MKKIKTQLKKTPLNQTPHIALLILAEQRHKMLTLMLDWYQQIRSELIGEVELTVFVASQKDLELLDVIEKHQDVHLIETSNGTLQGERNNEALLSLKNKGVHAVLPLLPGDLISKSMIKSQAAFIKEGALFTGLLDTYIYDPNEFKFMYWEQHRFESHPSRVAPIGYTISSGLLDALKWRLWPNQVKPADGFHKSILERLGAAFKKAPPASCFSQSMEKWEGVAISLKSELARALYEEGNWQKLQGLSYRSFENEVEDHVSENWIKRLNDFDERIKLEILLEMPAEGATPFWQSHYDFCVYKFLPYAEVKLRLLCTDETIIAPSGWSSIVCSGETAAERYQSALTQLKDEEGTLYLFAGPGGLVDLKTIEHYLIHSTRDGARLLMSVNFLIADEETRQLYFWPGMTSGYFTEAFGFGACIHRSYLDQLDWALFSASGLQETAIQTLSSLARADETRHQTVFFKCATHKLGSIALGFEGLLGFEDKVRLTDLQLITINHIPSESYDPTVKTQLEAWAKGLKFKPVEFQSSSKTTPLATSHDTESTMSAMSPLERAKALNPQNHSTSTSHSTSEDSNDTLSALERAKALLNRSKDQAQAKTSTPTSMPTEATPATPSPLERAKALLAKSKEAVASPTQVQPSTASSSPTPVAPKEMSPIEKAKALLARAEASTTQSQIQEASLESTKQENTQSIIDSAIQNAEAVVAQLTVQRDAALKAVQEAVAREGNKEENPASSLLCEQGEIAFGDGDLNKAAQLFESALLVDANSTRALSNLGVVAMQSEHPWQALSYLLLALIKDHEDENVVSNLQGLVSAYPELKVAQSLFM